MLAIVILCRCACVCYSKNHQEFDLKSRIHLVEWCAFSTLATLTVALETLDQLGLDLRPWIRLDQIGLAWIRLETLGHSCKIGNAPNLTGKKTKSMLKAC